MYRRRRRSVAIGFACADRIRSVESALIIAAKLAVLQDMHRACRRTADVCRNSPVGLARRVGGGVPALRGAEIDRRWRACGTRRSARLLRVCMPQSRDGPPRRHAGRNLPIGLASHSKRFVPGVFMIRSFFPSSIRRAALAVTIAGIAGAAVAADEPAPTFSEAIAQSAHRAEWKRMISSEKRVPGWLKSDNRVSSPYRREQVEGASYLVGWMCKPHDCAANQFYGVIDEDSHRMWGMLVTLPQTPGAYDAPSKYASFRWFGKPDERMKTYLQDQLKQDPNWK
ncbi:conserved hypothetical protein [Burkholderia pseudomallei 668]|nr:conserved hypothetical protein [Burkholderia pseudomallei 668]